MPHLTCSVVGCDGEPKRLAMCDKCYMRSYYLKRRGKAHFEKLRQAQEEKEAALLSLFKRCAKCKTEQPKSEFKGHQKTFDRLDSWCRGCHRADALIRFDSEKARARYQEKRHDPGFKQKRREVYSNWREKHPKRAAESHQRWIDANPERANLIRRNASGRRRARKKAQAVGVVDYTAILERVGMFCHICKTDIPSMKDLHFDHVIPLAKGGPHSEENILPAHSTCNLRKGAKLAA